ncbi:MAG: hypothetical protein IT458_03310 [Planctomycetes bacterium]|nr:hypothetical protein [Planctomycetota bacterium]
MRLLARSLLALVPMLLLACAMRPPAEVQAALSVSPDLAAQSPSDVAVMPVQDATTERRAQPYVEEIREELARTLVRRRYAPLAARLVDAALSGQPKAASVTDVAVLSSHVGRFSEDAILGVRIQWWDETQIMATGRLRLTADVTMISSKDRKVLWSGSFSADVKAGGEGPAPLDRVERIRDASLRFSQQLGEQLPARRMDGR